MTCEHNADKVGARCVICPSSVDDPASISNSIEKVLGELALLRRDVADLRSSLNDIMASVAPANKQKLDF